MNSGNAARVGLYALATALVAVESAQAFNPQPDPPISIPVGITETQTAELHVVHVPGAEVSGIQPTPFLVALGIFDELGRLVATTTVRVEQGQVMSLRISGWDLGLRGADRRKIYGVVQCLGGVARRVQCAQSIYGSMEILDAANAILWAGGIVPCIVPILSREGSNPPDDI